MKLRMLTPLSQTDAWSPLVNRMFEDFFAPAMRAESNGWNPRMNIAETAKEYQVSVELPGVEEKDIDVSLHEGLLTVKGSRQSEKESKDKNFHRIEAFYGDFQRTVQLPDHIEADKVSANFKNGVLQIAIPKLDQIKPQARKIKIEAKS